MSDTATARRTEASDDAIDAREAEILGQPQRVAPLAPDEVDDEAKAVLAEIYTAFGNTEIPAEIPELYRLMFRNAALFRCEIAMVVQLLLKGQLPPRERELVILRVTWACGSPNPYGEHVEMAKMCGVTPEEIARVTEGPDAPGWGEHDRALLAGTDELIARQALSDETWDILAQSWTERQLMEFPVVVGQYFASSLQHNALRTRLSPYNKGLRHR